MSESAGRPDATEQLMAIAEENKELRRELADCREKLEWYRDSHRTRLTSPAGPDALAEWHDRLGACIDQIGQPDYSLRELVDTLRDIRDGLFALRSRPEDSRDAELASAARRYVGIYKGWIKCEDSGAALNAAFNELCDAAMSQQEPQK